MKITILIILSSLCLYSKDRLFELQTKIEENSLTKISFNYIETLERLHHNFTPLLITKYNFYGKIETDNIEFQKFDTIIKSNSKYNSKTYLNSDFILHHDFRKNTFTELDTFQFQQEKIDISRYTPYFITNLILKNKLSILNENQNQFILFSEFNKNLIACYINKDNYLIEEIISVKHDDNFGNDTTIYKYLDYDLKFKNPTKIFVSKLNGILKDTVLISDLKYINNIIPFANKPENYYFNSDINENEELSQTKINSNISFINFKKAGVRSLIVEFKNYILVADAPLNSENGKLLLDNLKIIYPKKPVKYFSFGHHHPHYTGGIRPFINNESEIITVEEDIDYIKLLASNDHSLKADELQFSKKKIKSKIFKDSIIFSDNNIELIIYHIGELSNHTKDYCIYYFKKEKLIVEDDLIFMNKVETNWKKPSKREIAIFKFINDKNIEVENLYQTWPLNSNSFILDIKFSDYKRYCELE